MGRAGQMGRTGGRRRRGVTLLEIMVVTGLIALLLGGAIMGVGSLRRARLRQAATLVSGAIRAAYNHANQSSRATRVVFDFEKRIVAIEESEGRMLVQSGDRTGGAAAASALEQEAVAESEKILEGPRAPRPAFQPVKTLAFDGKQSGKELPSGISFRRVEVQHEDDPVESDRVYLYFWPGGQTEHAAVQLQRGQDAGDADVLTVLVAPLTGKVRIEKGPYDMPRPRGDDEASEREDPGP